MPLLRGAVQHSHGATGVQIAPEGSRVAAHQEGNRANGGVLTKFEVRRTKAIAKRNREGDEVTCSIRCTSWMGPLWCTKPKYTAMGI